ncbi:glycosyl hydrolase family 95 catalytic domain-containing protein [Flagellimonas sp. S174]|uniref:glycosyl hydrolase family 95 catalytic domain-containing protein n=1 Tax=Flagellimonas sp. S174 TaxID=3410790 RepID=UPI003BF4EA36
MSTPISQENQGWQISSGKTDAYTGIVLANGRIGILPEDRPFRTKSIILNNVYEKESRNGVSKILLGMNFANLELEVDGIKISEENIANFHQTLNMKEASFTTTFKHLDKAEISYTIYALRNIQYSGYVDVQINPLKNILLKATGIIETPEEYSELRHSFEVLEDLETTMPVLRTIAKTRFGRHTVGTSATFIWHAINSTRENQRPSLAHENISDYDNRLSFKKELKKGEEFEFAWTGAECTTQDFSDPQNESERFVIFNLLTPREELLNGHKALWENLWESDIIIEGNLHDQLDVRLALYHLYSFSRGDSDLSIAPMGLSSQNYNGHIFWDTELWMFPPLLLLDQDIARSLVNYRSNRLEKAKQRAINFGYKGAMFPWESDDTGEEATPSWALTGTFEHHITADVAIAFWNYYRVTQNLDWLKDKGYPLIKEVANFWLSRAVKLDDSSYSIKNVVGANEFAPNVDDNAFTNGAAITALEFAAMAAIKVGETPNPKWVEVASRIKLHKFPDGTTKEHSEYDGDRIKQADVNLLTYPLNIINDEFTIEKDLKYYEPKLAEEGPAMGIAIFAVIHARMGNDETAYQLYKRSYEPNKRAPFGALAECATSDNPYFATGAGGMLQVVLFGFAGLDITDEGIVQKKPCLPKEWQSLIVKGVGVKKKTYEVKALEFSKS